MGMHSAVSMHSAVAGRRLRELSAEEAVEVRSGVLMPRLRMLLKLK